ncbi:MAG TPA: PhzF family phenazine biosynthesis protein [Ignavibacteria bacterium]|nr:PhzF family phenazine biosynthesis protein [Ignavibacteria bacterium]HQY51424.1 PhzF family phenazine biosynthesis protein [Ignavibacteria bacterium]HRA99246.1 PhzF family phenazine biosynthesis protein [Ignavibacteria bacterium]
MIKIFTVDAFTDRPFSGNPAAVCLPNVELSEEVMQKIAFEMNLSETAFVTKLDDGFSLRWFTPKAEVELCGHATLASAHILWQEKMISENEEAVFYSKYKGILKAKKSGSEITLNFPVNKPLPSDRNEILEKALGVNSVSLNTIFTTEHHYIVELNSEENLKNVKPDFSLLETLPKYGVIITSKSDDPEFDFVSRFFAPSKGVKEDPVTGSAHCVLAPFWSEKLGKKKMNAFQASERGGVLSVELKDERVLISGNAVTVTAGELFLHTDSFS